MALPLVLIAAAAAAAQSVQDSAPGARSPSAGRQFADQRMGRAFMSPMGEPFFGRAAGEDGLAVWFEQADRNHDGSISADEMAADADRFFKTLDTNHDGEIDPDEIAHYENVIAPEVRTRRMGSGAGLLGGGQLASGRGGGRYGGGGGRGHRGSGRYAGGAGLGRASGSDEESGAARFGLLEIPEPVASADADFNRGVSAQEFRAAAASRFQLLDSNHGGRLTLAQLEDIRRAAASASRRPTRNDSSSDGQASPQPLM